MVASVDRVRGVVESILGDSPITLLALKRRLASELAIEPKAEVLQALAALPGLDDPRARDLAMRATVLHLVLQTALSEVWDRTETDPAALDRGLAALPEILDLARAEHSALTAALDEVDRRQRDAISKLHGALWLPEDPVIAALAVVPELARLAAAVRAGRLADDAPHLSSEETEILNAAAAPAGDGNTPAIRRPDRALVDAVALRSAIERAMGEAEPHQSAHALLLDLRSAHNVVSLRLDALRARRFEETRKSDEVLDAAR